MEQPRAPQPEGEDSPTKAVGPYADTPYPDAAVQLRMLGTYLRAQRQIADLSLRQLAEMTNVSNAYLSQIERGLHQPSLKVLRSIAAALNLSTETLLAQAGFADAAAPADARDARGSRRTGDRVPSATDTEAAIRSDPALTPEEREALLTIYRQLRDRRV